jgi:hypothetical protein
MNIIKRENGNILFEDDYNYLIDKLLEDIKPQESIESLVRFYKEENPSFLEKLLYYTRISTWAENSDFLKENLITQEEYAYLDKITSSEYARNEDFNTIEDTKIEFEKIEVNYELKNEGLSLCAAYTELYIEILYFIKSNKGTEENTFDVLTTQEKLLLLELLVDNGKLNSISSLKMLEVTLPLITGIKSSTMDKALKKHPKWYKTASLQKGELNHRLKSLQNVNIELDKRGIKNTDINNILLEKMSEINLKINKL